MIFKDFFTSNYVLISRKKNNYISKDWGNYIFGCEKLGIPQNAGYYFGIKIIREYRKITQMNDMKKLLETPLEEIYQLVVCNTR